MLLLVLLVSSLELVPSQASVLTLHTVRRLVGRREKEVRHLTISDRKISRLAQHCFSGSQSELWREIT